MSKTALITGRTRGVSPAIAKAVSETGYGMAANYAGNDEAASEITKKTGVPTKKWSDKACVADIAQVEADLGPIDMVINTRLDGLFPLNHPIGAGVERGIEDAVLNKQIQPQIPHGRLGEPEEVARCAMFLASDEAGGIGGSTLSAHGGKFLS